MPPGDDDGAGAAARLDAALDQVARSLGAHLGALYLPAPGRRALHMTAVTGVPGRLARPWSRVASAAPVPVAEAVRSGRPVWLPTAQELARRFPRTALAFPYPIAMYVFPLMGEGVCWGAVLLLWPHTRAPGLSAAEVAAAEEAAARMADELRAADSRGHPVRPRAEPRALRAPAPDGDPATALTDRLTEGLVGLDPNGQVTCVTRRAAALLGRPREQLLHEALWEALTWLNDPAFENAYLSALFSRAPADFSARRPDGTWLWFQFTADATGVTVRVAAEASPDASGGRAPEDAPSAPARAGTLYHLLHLASALTEAASVREVTASLGEQLMPVLDARGLALLVAEEGRMRVVSSLGFPPELPAHFDGLLLADESAAVKAVESGAPGFYPTSAELLAAYPRHRQYGGMGAFAFLPLARTGGVFGCCVLGYASPRRFPPEERAELVALAGMIAQALDRARLYDANVTAAHALQDGLLPRRLPDVPGLRVAARYRPAAHNMDVGGDFYDLLDFGGTAVGAVIGDVQGHSVEAATVMGQVRTAVRTHARTGARPDDVLARTNRFVVDLDQGLFCSCLYAHLDVPGHRVLLASAGHPPPVLRHPDHRADVLDLPPGLLLGIDADADFETVEVPLPPGSTLALYTDGLVERPGTDLTVSIESLARRLSHAAGQSLDALGDATVEWAAGTVVAQNADDMALLLLAREP